MIIKLRTLPLKMLFSKYILKNFTAAACVSILYLRSFFITEYSKHIFLTRILPTVSIVWIFLNNTYSPIYFNAFTNAYFFIVIGINLIFIDALGAAISENIMHNASTPLLSILTLTRLKQSSNFIKRHVSTKAALGLLIGKTPMTATGRATLLAGAVTGTVWLGNEYLNRQGQNQRASDDRQGQNQRAAADRQSQDQREAKTRAFDIFKHAREQHDKTPWYAKKGPAPEWSEENYQKWLEKYKP